jgi:hypothetical protein
MNQTGKTHLVLALEILTKELVDIQSDWCGNLTSSVGHREDNNN